MSEEKPKGEKAGGKEPINPRTHRRVLRFINAARTPDAIVKRLNAEIAKVLSDPEAAERLTAQGLEPVIMTPAEVRRYSETDVSRWARLIKTAGIKAEK